MQAVHGWYRRCVLQGQGSRTAYWTSAPPPLSWPLLVTGAQRVQKTGPLPTTATHSTHTRQPAAHLTPTMWLVTRTAAPVRSTRHLSAAAQAASTACPWLCCPAPPPSTGAITADKESTTIRLGWGWHCSREACQVGQGMSGAVLGGNSSGQGGQRTGAVLQAGPAWQLL